MVCSEMPYNIYSAYCKCTVFCPEIDFWSLDWCKQLSTWERFNYQLQMLGEAGSRTLATWLILSASRYLPPPTQICTLDISHLGGESRCSRHLEIKRRWLVTKYAGVPRPCDASQIFSGFWRGSKWLLFEVLKKLECLCTLLYLPHLLVIHLFFLISFKRSNCDNTQ